MELDPQIAEKIVENLKDILDYEVNLFNRDGYIIASTDKTRIGTLHIGAMEAALNNKEIIIRKDFDLPGARKGINIPIHLDGLVSAVVGISGDPDDVGQYAHIIKKMTEILIKENWNNISKFNKQLKTQDLIRFLIDKNGYNKNSLNEVSKFLGIDFSLKRRIIIIKFNKEHNYSFIQFEDIATEITHYLKKHTQSFYRLLNNELQFFLDVESAYDLNQFVNIVISSLKKLIDDDVYIGISEIAKDINDYYNQYNNAHTALSWAIYTKDTTPVYYKDLNYELIIISMNVSERQQILNSIFGNITSDEMEQFNETFQTYIQVNGSIKQGAEILFIHKNTFQNRLDKIYNHTGFNPRNLEDFSTLQIAFSIWNYNLS